MSSIKEKIQIITNRHYPSVNWNQSGRTRKICDVFRYI